MRLRNFMFILIFTVSWFTWGLSPGYSAGDTRATGLDLEEVDTTVAELREQVKEEIPEKDFLYRPRDVGDTEKMWMYEFDLPEEVITRKIIVDTAGNRVVSSYWFDAGRERSCRRVMEAVFRQDQAETMAEEKGLFDVCENVRSVSDKRLKLRWKNKELRKVLTVEVQRRHRQVQVKYKIPLLGH